MEVISISEAARRLRCARSTLYRAIARGDLNATDTGSSTVIIADEQWEQYAPQETGGRLHRSYLKANAEKQEG